MSAKKGEFSRREFIKTAGAVSLGSTLLPLGSSSAATNASEALVPKRPFGNSGIDVAILGLGGVLGMSDQLVFRQALKMGVTYWDTADSYGWGKNEKAIGKYFARFPQDRQKVFLVTKAATADPKKLTHKLKASLQKMNTDYVDLYLIHHVSDVDNELTGTVKAWAQKAKDEGKIRLFGFSAHKNMEASMIKAAQLGWIDGIMMSYNYRLMVKKEMQIAVNACVQAGIGLTAMKSQATFSARFYSSIGAETDAALSLTEKFLQKGYTTEQAKLKVIWENPQIASICSAISNMTILQANVAAAVSKTKLSAGDKQRLSQYAGLTAPGYCAGCARICESAVEGQIPISDILRYCMYYYSYGQQDLAARFFRDLPPRVWAGIQTMDFTRAEVHCPQNIAIGKLMQEAYKNFT